MKISRSAISPAEWLALAHGAVVHVRTGEARFTVSGKGALTCLQGLVTCDLAGAPDGSRAYGALLTSKGMIVAPLWIARTDAGQFTVETPAEAADALRDVLVKSLPPRLCRWEDVTEATTGLGLYGPAAGAGVGPFPGALPAVVRGARGFDGDLAADTAALVVAELTAAGAVPASDALLAGCRILAGIPSLGAEIDDKTLPQEVRGEELGAISYTKGCYLGQETVARVHFRGHPNRRLALLVLDGEPDAAPAEASQDGKAVGRLTSAAWSDDLDRWVGQAVIRREVEDGATLQAGDTTGVVRLDRWLRDP